MRKNLVIFGSGEIAELAYFYFKNDAEYNIVAFTIDSNFIRETQFCKLPIIEFETISEYYPPSENHFFIALSYSKLNAIRKEKYLAAKKAGYKCTSFISSKATILNENDIGENCFILEDNTIQPFVKIGNNVTLWSGNHIGHHSIIKDHTFIASHVVISGGVEIGEQCFIGVNATLRDHIKVGDRCVIGAGALLLSDAEPEKLYIGNKTLPSDLPSTMLKTI